MYWNWSIYSHGAQTNEEVPTRLAISPLPHLYQAPRLLAILHYCLEVQALAYPLHERLADRAISRLIEA